MTGVQTCALPISGLIGSGYGYQTYRTGEKLKKAGGTSEEVGGYYLQTGTSAVTSGLGFKKGYTSFNPLKSSTIQTVKLRSVAEEQIRMPKTSEFWVGTKAEITTRTKLKLGKYEKDFISNKQIIEIGSRTQATRISGKFTSLKTGYIAKGKGTITYGGAKGLSKRIGKDLFITSERGAIATGTPRVMKGTDFPKLIKGKYPKGSKVSTFESRALTKRLAEQYKAGSITQVTKKGLIFKAGERRSEEHTSELQSHSFISYAVFCLKKKNQKNNSLS